LPLGSGVLTDSQDRHEHVASEYRALDQLARDGTRDGSYAFPKQGPGKDHPAQNATICS
jgi:hypothetical protein